MISLNILRFTAITAADIHLLLLHFFLYPPSCVQSHLPFSLSGRKTVSAQTFSFYQRLLWTGCYLVQLPFTSDGTPKSTRDSLARDLNRVQTVRKGLQGSWVQLTSKVLSLLLRKNEATKVTKWRILSRSIESSVSWRLAWSFLLFPKIWQEALFFHGSSWRI